MFKKIFSKILDTIFPINCSSCGTYGNAFCSSCVSKIRRAEINKSLPDFITPVFSYKDPGLRRAIWKLKYSNVSSIAESLAPYINDLIVSESENLINFNGSKKIILIPIPIHKNRYKVRAHNQSEILAREIIKDNTNELVCAEYDVLYKSKKTLAQVKTRTRAERIKNIKDSFSVKNTDKVTGADIILVDDVVTTGATLSEARKVLLEAGARSVTAVTLAH